MPEFLERIVIRHLRGIEHLSIDLEFPVTVLAGPNACGKTTVLFALACCYRSPGERKNPFAPATMFPNLSLRKHPELSDQTFDNATDKKTNIAKNKFHSFCETVRFDSLGLIRQIAREEAKRQTGVVKKFVDDLETQIRNWQSRK
ncbi:MAG: ATP-binding protein [Saprospiraceae bacterium]